MDWSIASQVGDKLQRHLKSLQDCPEASFIQKCHHFVDWIQENELLKNGLLHLQSVDIDEIRKNIKQITIETISQGNYFEGCKVKVNLTTSNAEENAASAWEILQTISVLHHESKDPQTYALAALSDYLTGEFTTLQWQGDPKSSIRRSVEKIRNFILADFFNFLTEKIEDRDIVFSSLVRYQQRSQEFHRSRLQKIADEGWPYLQTKETGENALAYDVKNYLLDQGVAYFAEPKSSSGKVDLLVLRSMEGEYIPVDTKYIPADESSSSIKKKLAFGFNQVTRYCRDFGKSEGFLVVFNRNPKKIQLQQQKSNKTPLEQAVLLEIDNKRIYYISIDIADRKSASKEGKAEMIEILTLELLKLVGEIETHSAAKT